ncbi:hypothetical protein AB0J63_37270 [Streptosporangium canum]|uniref:hypothetical protein n=1 Tax=Streptosporangium canum TaxID=324952 RepID=UPI00343C4339
MDAEAEAALAEDPGFPMGNALAAYLGLLTTEPADARGARERFARFRSGADVTALPPRERAHVHAVQALLDGDLLTCGTLLGRITEECPRDAPALIAGHQVDFLTGDARALRDRVGGALSAWGEDDRHYGHLLGMYAFGLEEAGHYDRSEEVGLRAVELNPRDVWGVHAVAPTYETQGRFGEGVRYLDDRLADWSTGTFFNARTWWHYSLYALEAGATSRVLDIYDSGDPPVGRAPASVAVRTARTARLPGARTGAGPAPGDGPAARRQAVTASRTVALARPPASHMVCSA